MEERGHRRNLTLHYSRLDYQGAAVDGKDRRGDEGEAGLESLTGNCGSLQWRSTQTGDFLY